MFNTFNIKIIDLYKYGYLTTFYNYYNNIDFRINIFFKLLSFCIFKCHLIFFIFLICFILNNIRNVYYINILNILIYQMPY